MATISARIGDRALHTDKLDPAKASARRRFIEAVGDKYPGIDRERLTAELMEIADKLSPSDPVADAKPDPLSETPREVVANALAMLRDPELIRMVVSDIGALGVAGEKLLGATVYLIGTSRLLSKPLAGIVQGLTASGKSVVIETVAGLFPPEGVIHAHKMTPEALVHMRRGALEHRFIVGGERSRKQDDDTADATRALREMLSDGTLTKLVPMKGANGTIETVQISQPGPIAYVESTTLQSILDEDRNRCIVLQTDETPEQTRRIIDLAAARKAGGSAAADADTIVARHHTAQRLLRRCEVRVPFAVKLGQCFPAERTDARRSFGHLLSMIEAVALLHQHQRIGEPADGAVIEATADDYALARKLLAGPFARALGSGLSDAARRFGERLAAVFGSEEFDSRDAAKSEKVIGDVTTIRQYLRTLVAEGVLDQTVPHQGRTPARYKVAAVPRDHATAAGLPQVAEVLGV